MADADRPASATKHPSAAAPSATANVLEPRRDVEQEAHKGSVVIWYATNTLPFSHAWCCSSTSTL
jgi:hypothetical protein